MESSSSSANVAVSASGSEVSGVDFLIDAEVYAFGTIKTARDMCYSHSIACTAVP